MVLIGNRDGKRLFRFRRKIEIVRDKLLAVYKLLAERFVSSAADGGRFLRICGHIERFTFCYVFYDGISDTIDRRIRDRTLIAEMNRCGTARPVYRGLNHCRPIVSAVWMRPPCGNRNLNITAGNRFKFGCCFKQFIRRCSRSNRRSSNLCKARIRRVGNLKLRCLDTERTRRSVTVHFRPNRKTADGFLFPEIQCYGRLFITVVCIGIGVGVSVNKFADICNVVDCYDGCARNQIVARAACSALALCRSKRRVEEGAIRRAFA